MCGSPWAYYTFLIGFGLGLHSTPVITFSSNSTLHILSSWYFFEYVINTLLLLSSYISISVFLAVFVIVNAL